jgi:hypothetical protein
MLNKTLLIFVLVLTLSNAAMAQEKTDKPKSKPFALVELASNLIEDGYTQTGNSFGLHSDVGYSWEQFELGVRGNNVYFEGERTHLVLGPHLAIISNFSDTSRFFLEHEERFYFHDSRRNGGKTTVGLLVDKYLIRFESLMNWWGLDMSKSRLSLTYEYYWGLDYSSDFQLGYNIPEENNTKPFFDSAFNIKYKKDRLEYYAEVILLSNLVSYISVGQTFSYRLGLKTQF